MIKRRAVIAGLGFVFSSLADAAWAQGDAANFPDRPIRVIVTVPAGGGVDTVTRIVTDKMRASLGQPLVVENRTGAGGNLAAETVYDATPDGYTLLASQPAPLTTNPFLYKSINYDPTKLTPIVVMSHVPNVVEVRQGFPAKTVHELIAYAKANPGKINCASQGIGTTSHLTAELFQTLTGTKFVHVPYKGTAPAVNDLIAGNVDLFFNELASALQLQDGGRARILAVLTKQRVAAAPNIPTLAEAGVQGCESDTWHALAAPPNTPVAIVTKLNAAANAALRDPGLLDRFGKLGIGPGGGTPAATGAFFKEETQRWGKVIREAGIQPQ